METKIRIFKYSFLAIMILLLILSGIVIKKNYDISELQICSQKSKTCYEQCFSSLLENNFTIASDSIRCDYQCRDHQTACVTHALTGTMIAIN